MRRSFLILAGVAVFALLVAIPIGQVLTGGDRGASKSKPDEAVTKVDCSRDGSILTVDGKRYAVNKTARLKHPELPDYRELKDEAIDGAVPLLCVK